MEQVLWFIKYELLFMDHVLWTTKLSVYQGTYSMGRMVIGKDLLAIEHVIWAIARVPFSLEDGP